MPPTEDGDCDILVSVRNELRATHEQGGCSDRSSGKKPIVSGFRHTTRDSPIAPEFFLSLLAPKDLIYARRLRKTVSTPVSSRFER
jgi:hypothetical protein